MNRAPSTIPQHPADNRPNPAISDHPDGAPPSVRVVPPGLDGKGKAGEPPILRLDIEQHYLAIRLFARPRWILDAALLWSRS